MFRFLFLVLSFSGEENWFSLIKSVFPFFPFKKTKSDLHFYSKTIKRRRLLLAHRSGRWIWKNSFEAKLRSNGGTYRAEGIIIWESRDGKAVVTNTNFIPAQQFGNNAFYWIPYTEFFWKATDLSNYGVANVAYMDAFPGSL